MFARDPEAKDFLTSGSGVAAGLRIQHSFAENNNLQDCRRIVQTFECLGGDKGVMEKYIRKACGLPPNEANDTLPDGTHVHHAGAASQEDESVVSLAAYAEHYARQLMSFEHSDGRRNTSVQYSDLCQSVQIVATPHRMQNVET